MKQVFILAAFCVWMFSCSEAGETKTDSVHVDSPVMDTVAATTDSSGTPSDSPAGYNVLPDDGEYPMEFPVQMKVFFTSSYCGGARPGEEMLAEKAVPKLLASSTLRFKNHFNGFEYLLRTDDAGIISGNMEQGKYDVYLTNDINTELATGFDAKCSLWLSEVLCQVKVTPDDKGPDVNIHFTCNPCDDQMKKRP